MKTTRSFTERPAEFDLSHAAGTILSGEWRMTVTETDSGQFAAECSFLPVSIPATRANAINLLAACRYSVDEEIAIMRLPDDDPVKIEHEAYIARVKDFVNEIGVL